MLVASSGRFRSKLTVFVSKHFFSYRFDYRAEWLRFTRTLAARELAARRRDQRAIKALADLVESPGGALWLRDERRGLPARRRAGTWRPIDAVEPARRLARHASSSGPRGSSTSTNAATEPGALSRARASGLARATLPAAWLVVPLIAGTELLGFVVLATPRTAIDVNWEVRDLLKTASRQAASYLGQIRATEALLEARKFDAFNRMSAFVVHDLKNLVAQLSLMLRNSERHRDNPEFQRDMLATVAHVVERMNQLMLQLRIGDDARSTSRGRSTLRRSCAASARPRRAADGRIELELAPGVLAIGHEERLEHVIGHLVQNALDATADGGRVTVRLFRDGALRRDRGRRHGHGHEPGVRPR